jgi:hypothetical protein
MEEKITNVSYNESRETIEFKIRDAKTTIDLKELQKKFGRIILNEKNIPKYIYGGGNIVFYMKDDDSDKEYVLRHSILTKFSIDEYKKEITKYYQLSELKIGVEIYYPSKENISSYNNRYIIIEHYDKGSVISFFHKTVNSIKKEKVIDKIFSLIDLSIDNKIYCLDVKFRNFVVKEISDIDVDVRMIDFEQCLLPIDNIVNKDLSDENKHLVYKNMILIQVFYNCPLYLQSYYLSKLNYKQIIDVYNIFSLDENNLKKSFKLFHNLFFYYLKNDFLMSFFTFETEKLSLKTESKTVSIHEILRINIVETHNFFTIIIQLVSLCLYMLFKYIICLKLDFDSTINIENKIKTKESIIFNLPIFEEKNFIVELKEKFDKEYKEYKEDDDESSDDDLPCVFCTISDGMKKKKSKKRSIKRKKRSKSIKRKKSKIRNKSIKRKKSIKKKNDFKQIKL